MTPRQQLDEFLKRYDPAIAQLAGAAIARLRKMFPGASVLVYDNYNALAVGFGPSERASLAAFSIAAYPRWVRLFFLQGAMLPDPHGRLEGTGNQVRSVRLESVDLLEDAEIRELLELAAEGAEIPGSPAGKIVIRSISKVQRPRRATPPKRRARP